MAVVLAMLPALAAGSALAQAPLSLAQVDIQLWPEYDRDATLVILDGELPAGTTLPVALDMRIPAAAASPHAVAVRNLAGALLDAPFTTAPSGDVIIVSFMTDQLAFRIEYYDPALTVSGSARTVAFQWTSDYAVAASSVRVQQPFGATGLSGDPALTALGVAADNLSYFERDFGPLAAGGQIDLTVTYTKPSRELTVDALGVGQPVAPTATNGSVSNPNLPWILGSVALGLGLLGVGGYFWGRGQRPAARRASRARPVRAQRERGHPAAVRRRHAAQNRRAAPPSASARAAIPAAPAEAGQTFCTHCGQRLVAGDRFCRACGAPVAAS